MLLWKMVSEDLRRGKDSYGKTVLILVVVEDGLRVAHGVRLAGTNSAVLILVVVEDGLRDSSRRFKVDPMFLS